MKRYIAMALLSVVLLLGGGCSMGNSAETKQININDVALAHMEQKYAEKFEYVRPWGNSMSGTHELLVQCASFPDQEILIQVENYSSENKLFRDNYLAVKYLEETIAFLSQSANSVFGESNLFYEVVKDGLSPELPADATFREFLADPRAPIGMLLEVKASNFSSRDQADLVGKLIADSGASFYLTILIVADDIYGTLDRVALGEKIAIRQFEDCVKISNISGNYQTRWLEKE